MPRTRRWMAAVTVLAAVAAVQVGAAAGAPAALPFALTPLPAGPTGAVLSTGATWLGVRDYGSIGVPGGSSSAGPCDTASAGGSHAACTTTIGLRIASLDLEGLADGCVCEGWGAAFQVGKPSGPFVSGSVQPGRDGATGGLDNVVSTGFWYGPKTGNPTWAVSSVDVGGHLRVIHHFTIDPRVVNQDGQRTTFRVNVSLQNLGPEPIFNVQYRRSVDFDAEPTPANEVVGYMLCNDLHGNPGCTEGHQLPAACGNPPSEVTWISSDAAWPADPTVAGVPGSSAYGAAPAPRVLPPPGTCPTGWLYNADAGPGDLGLVVDLNFTKRAENTPNPRSVAPGGPWALAPGNTYRFSMWYGAEKVVQARNPDTYPGTVATLVSPCNQTPAGATPAPTDASCGPLAGNDKLVDWASRQTLLLPVQVPLPYAPPPVFDITANALDCALKQAMPATLLGTSPLAGMTVQVPFLVTPNPALPAVPAPGTVTPPSAGPLPFIVLPSYAPGPAPPAPQLLAKPNNPGTPCPVLVAAGTPPVAVLGGGLGYAYSLVPGGVLPVNPAALVPPGTAGAPNPCSRNVVTPVDPTLTTMAPNGACSMPVVGESPAYQPEYEICELAVTQVCVIAHSSYAAGAANSGPEGTVVGQGNPDPNAGGNAPGDGVAGYGSCGTQYPGGPACGKDAVETDGYYFWGFHNDTTTCLPPPPKECVDITACGAQVNKVEPPSGCGCEDADGWNPPGGPSGHGMAPPSTQPDGTLVMDGGHACPKTPHAHLDETHDYCLYPDVVDFFDASDPDDTPYKWYWDFGDGTQSDAQNPQHTYAADGDYTVTFTVYDAWGAASSTVRIVHVGSGCPTFDAHPPLGGGGCGTACRPRDHHNGAGDLLDSDNDTIPDAIDNCPYVRNADQADLFHTGYGDVCNPDLDGDGILNQSDNCPRTPNRDQHDLDGDLQGDACDRDCDGDGVPNLLDPTCGTAAGYDNCPLLRNPDQRDGNQDGVGDLCAGLLGLDAATGSKVATHRADGQGLRPTASVRRPLGDCVDAKGLVPGLAQCLGPAGWAGAAAVVAVSAWTLLVGLARRQQR